MRSQNASKVSDFVSSDTRSVRRPCAEYFARYSYSAFPDSRPRFWSCSSALSNCLSAPRSAVQSDLMCCSSELETELEETGAAGLGSSAVASVKHKTLKADIA